MCKHSISIIIPVLNEASTIEVLLTYLSQKATATNISEISVIDGGSEDETMTLVHEFSKKARIPIYVIPSEKGRAKQMNLGAETSQGSILYFLHADSNPPQDFDTLIISEVKKQNLAGCFKMKFESNHWWLRLASWGTHLKWRACRGGDQSQFITKDLFDEIGGFNEQYTIYEDNILINELYKRKQFVVIQEWIGTSARLYEKKGVWKLQYRFWMIYLKKWLGADSEALYSYYKKHISS
ncbi:MAG: rSAM/selenodomain-associated transferase 2 [Candidatus Paceibacteria bacterium]|jgi:rSAM/selenodomain-associated transferase 2